MDFGVEQDAHASVSGEGLLLKTFELKDEVEQTFKFNTWIDKGHLPYFTFVNGSSKPITQVRTLIRRRKLNPGADKEPYVGPGVRISQLRIEGPFHGQWPPESFRTTYDANEIPDLSNETVREALVLRFAERAFRRSVTKQEVSPFISFLNQQHAATNEWHEFIVKTFAAMMASVT